MFKSAERFYESGLDHYRKGWMDAHDGQDPVQERAAYERLREMSFKTWLLLSWLLPVIGIVCFAVTAKLPVPDMIREYAYAGSFLIAAAGISCFVRYRSLMASIKRPESWVEFNKSLDSLKMVLGLYHSQKIAMEEADDTLRELQWNSSSGESEDSMFVLALKTAREFDLVPAFRSYSYPRKPAAV